MYWSELSDAVYRYATATGRDKIDLPTCKLDIVGDIFKMFEHLNRGNRARLDLLVMKLQKYSEYALFTCWYDEHIKNTVEHEIAGIVLKIACIDKVFKCELLGTHLLTLDVYHILSSYSRPALVLANQRALNNLHYYTVSRFLMVPNAKDERLLEPLKCIGQLLNILGLEEIGPYINYRLDYIHEKQNKNGIEYRR